MKDWLGQEYNVGDKVVYAAMSGRSANLVLGEVTEIVKVFRNEDFEWQRIGIDEDAPFRTVWRRGEQTQERRDTEIRVKVLPMKAARWQQHYSGKPVTLTVTENITKWNGPTP